MKIELRYFASVREQLGRAGEQAEVPVEWPTWASCANGCARAAGLGSGAGRGRGAAHGGRPCGGACRYTSRTVAKWHFPPVTGG